MVVVIGVIVGGGFLLQLSLSVKPYQRARFMYNVAHSWQLPVARLRFLYISTVFPLYYRSTIYILI